MLSFACFVYCELLIVVLIPFKLALYPPITLLERPLLDLVTLSFSLSIPIASPSPVHLPNWVNTLEGEFIPSAFLAALTAPLTTPFIAPTTLLAIPLIPLISPCIISLPTWTKLIFLITFTACVIKFFTVVGTCLIFEVTALNKLDIIVFATLHNAWNALAPKVLRVLKLLVPVDTKFLIKFIHVEIPPLKKPLIEVHILVIIIGIFLAKFFIILGIFTANCTCIQFQMNEIALLNICFILSQHPWKLPWNKFWKKLIIPSIIANPLWTTLPIAVIVDIINPAMKFQAKLTTVVINAPCSSQNAVIDWIITPTVSPIVWNIAIAVCTNGSIPGANLCIVPINPFSDKELITFSI